VAWVDVPCSLNFQNYFSIEKVDMAWGDFLKFLEIFFYLERWCDMWWCAMVPKFSELSFNEERWCDILLEFLEIFFDRERWHGMRWSGILACWENWN
jgi:hypothetical protein